jgi:hypothetical protein
MTPAQYNEYQRQAEVIEEEKKRQELIKFLTELAKQYPNDAELGNAIRKLITN